MPSVGKKVDGGAHRAIGVDIDGGDLNLSVTKLHGSADLAAAGGCSGGVGASLGWLELEAERATLAHSWVGDEARVLCGAAVQVDEHSPPIVRRPRSAQKRRCTSGDRREPAACQAGEHQPRSG